MLRWAGSARNDHRPVKHGRTGSNHQDPGLGSAHERMVPPRQAILIENPFLIPGEPVPHPGDRP